MVVVVVEGKGNDAGGGADGEPSYARRFRGEDTEEEEYKEEEEEEDEIHGGPGKGKERGAAGWCGGMGPPPAPPSREAKEGTTITWFSPCRSFVAISRVSPYIGTHSDPDGEGRKKRGEYGQEESWCDEEGVKERDSPEKDDSDGDGGGGGGEKRSGREGNVEEGTYGTPAGGGTTIIPCRTPSSSFPRFWCERSLGRGWWGW